MAYAIPTDSQLASQQKGIRMLPSVVVVEVMCFLRILSAIACASIRHRASAIASQVGFVVFSSQQASISVLQRLSSPRWFL